MFEKQSNKKKMGIKIHTVLCKNVKRNKKLYEINFIFKF